MLEHFVQQMQFEFKLSMVEDVTYFPGFQEKKMNDCTFNSHSIYAGSRCIQLLWCNQMLKDVIKDSNEDVNQDVLGKMYDMLVISFQFKGRMSKLLV